MSFFAAGGLVLTAGTAIYSGIKQKEQAKELRENNPYPVQDVPQAQKDNVQLAKQMANEGLPAQQYALAMKNVERQRANAIRSAQDRRSGNGLIGAIQQNANDASARVDVANANARLQNQRQLLGVNGKTAAYQQAAFDWNQKNKYNQNYNYSQQLLGAGNANILHGVDSAAAGIIGLGAQGLFGRGDGSYSGNSRKSTINAEVGRNPYDPNVSAGTPGSAMNLDFIYQ